MTTRNPDARELALEVEEERSYSDKKIKLVSDMVNAKVKVDYNSNYDNNCAMKIRGGGYRIELNGSIPVRAGLDHELSHVREGSLDSTFWKPFKTIITAWYAKNVPTDMKSRTADNLTNTVCRDAMNIIEDIRIESIDGEIFMGRKRAYNNMCREAGLEWNDNGYAPKMGEIHAYVLAKRFFREDMIPDVHTAEATKIFEQCKCTTVRGIHKIFSDWLKGSLGNYILEQIKILKERQDSNESTNNNKRNEAKKQFDKIEKAIDEMIQDNHPEDMSDEELNKYQSLKDRLSQADDNVHSADREIYACRREIENESMKSDVPANTIKENHTQGFYPTDKQVKAMEDKMNKTDPSKESKKKAKQIEDMKSLHGSKPAPPLNKNVEQFNSNQTNSYYPKLEKATIFNDAVAEIRRTFTTLKQKAKPKLSDEGDDIDIESFLEQVKKGGNEFYINNKKVEGTSILIAIDCSGSMREEGKLKTCKDITATMFRAVSNIPTIDMKAVLYGGASDTTRKTGVLEINSEKQCELIGWDRYHMLTPTAISLVYCAEALNRMRGNKKLMIYLTDGVPQSADRATDSRTLAKQAGKTYRNIKAANPNMIIKPLMISSHNIWDETIKTIFGSDHLTVPIDDVSNFIRKQFKEAVLNDMK